MTWVKLDDRFFDNPKIAAISDAAQLAFLKALCYCAGNLTDGKFPLKKAKEFASPKVIKELVPDLWEMDGDSQFVVHDYLQFNPSREQVLAERADKHEQKSRAGSKGAAKRWQTDSRVIAEPMAEAWQSDGPVPVPDPVPFLPPLLLPREGDEISKLLVDFGKVGLMSPGLVQSIEDDIEEFGLELVQKVVSKALGSGKTELPWNWCHSTLVGWRANGGPDEPKNERRAYVPGRAPAAAVSVADRFAARVAGR